MTLNDGSSAAAEGDEDHALEVAVVERCSGERSLAAHLLRAFIRQAQEDLEVIAAAAKAGNAEMLGRAAHRLKGAAGNLGLETCRQIAAELEQRSRAGRVDGTEPFAQSLQAEADRIARMRILSDID